MPNAEASAQLRAIAVALKAAGSEGGALKREMNKALRAGAGPLTAAVQDAARAQLPKAGGLNEQVAGQKVSVSIRTGPKTAGVRLTTTAPDTSQTDSGYVRHPVFARSYDKGTGAKVKSGSDNSHRGGAGGRAATKWVTQQIPQAAGWWSQTLTDRSPEITPALIAVLEEVSAAINKGF